MNYDDINNDGIPPYDLPIFDNSNEGSEKKQNISPQVSAQEQHADDALPPQPQIDEHEIEEISLESMHENSNLENIEESTVDSMMENDEAAPLKSVSEKKNSRGSKILLPVVIILLGLFLTGSLVLIYADTLNIPYLSEMMAKLNIGNSNKVITVDEKKMDMPVPPQGEEELDAEMQKLMGEDMESTGVEVSRTNALPMPNGAGPLPNGPVGMPNGIPNNQQAPVGPVGMPQDLGNMPQGNNGYPPLQNGLGQQTEVNVIQPYSRNIGRLDPFNPSGGTNQLYDVIIPPTNPTPDEKAQQLMALKISGIMYTADSPSAIINIAGSDQLVRKGDRFNGLKKKKITKDKVTVRAGSNVYTASVGEILNIEQVGVNSIPNLNKKFGGPYSKGKDRIIEINMLE